MTLQKIWRGVFCVLASAVLAASGATYDIDPAHTVVGFTVRHMVINNVRGSFKAFEGTVEYGRDAAELQAKGTIKAASIDTGIERRDEHLRGEDFFDVAKYPEMRFVSTGVVRQGGQYVLVGDFTMHGVTREIELPMVISGPVTDPQGRTRIGLEWTTTINRKDYGINWSQVLDNGGLVVADEVRIEISAEAVQRAEEPEPPAE